MLPQDLHDNTAVLRSSAAGVVGRNGFVLTVADDVDPVQPNVMLVVQIPFHRFGTFETKPLVERR